MLIFSPGSRTDSEKGKEGSSPKLSLGLKRQLKNIMQLKIKTGEMFTCSVSGACSGAGDGEEAASGFGIDGVISSGSLAFSVGVGRLGSSLGTGVVLRSRAGSVGCRSGDDGTSLGGTEGGGREEPGIGEAGIWMRCDGGGWECRSGI